MTSEEKLLTVETKNYLKKKLSIADFALLTRRIDRPTSEIDTYRHPVADRHVSTGHCLTLKPDR